MQSSVRSESEVHPPQCAFLPAIFCTGDKGFIDINFCSQSTDDDGKDQKWDKVVGDVEKNVQGVSSFYYGAVSRYICISFEYM